MNTRHAQGTSHKELGVLHISRRGMSNHASYIQFKKS